MLSVIIERHNKFWPTLAEFVEIMDWKTRPRKLLQQELQKNALITVNLYDIGGKYAGVTMSKYSISLTEREARVIIKFLKALLLAKR